MHKNTSKVLSPHLQVYKFPFAVITSILHRLTGIFLFALAVVLIWSYYFSYFCDGKAFYNLVHILFTFSPFLNNFLLLLISFSFSFHMVNGLRHVMWDFSLFSGLNAIKSSNFVVVALSLLMTVFVFLLMNGSLK